MERLGQALLLSSSSGPVVGNFRSDQLSWGYRGAKQISKKKNIIIINFRKVRHSSDDMMAPDRVEKTPETFYSQADWIGKDNFPKL